MIKGHQKHMFMHKLNINVFATGLLLAITTAAVSAQGVSSQVTLPGATQYVAGSLCTKPDAVIFSCPLEKTSKIVSVCAAGATAPHRFYYAFGKPGAVEMTYPKNGVASSDAFEYALLRYAGATGGPAYSFTLNNYKYIVYQVSGTGFDLGGVMVRRVGERRALSNMKCASNDIMQTEDESFDDEMRLWRHDSDLDMKVLSH